MKNQILELIKKHLCLKIEDILSFLSLNDSKTFIEVNKILNQLEDEHFIFFLNNKYYYLDEINYFRSLISYSKYNNLYIKHNNQDIKVKFKKDTFLYPQDDVIYTIHDNYCEVIKLIKHNLKYIYGNIYYNKRQLKLEPFEDYKISFTLTNPKKIHILPNKMVRCYIKSYNQKILVVDKVLGDVNDVENIIEMIISKYNISKDFDSKIIKQLNDIDSDIEIDNYKDYKDFTSKYTVTIDGINAKDFDDAISIEKIDNGYNLYVFIADVTHYVKQNSLLDKVACFRSTSIYYPNSVIPMLPFKLSNDLCSLVENKNRLTLCVKMNIDNDGSVNDYNFYKAIIKSNKRLTYDFCNNYYKGYFEIEDSDLKDLLESLKELSNILSIKHQKNYQIEFDSDECEFEILNNKVKKIKKRKQELAEKMIENFMIEANQTVATYMYYLDLPMIYRNHDLPKLEKLEVFLDTLTMYGYSYKGNKFDIHKQELVKALNYFKDKNVYPTISNLLLRSMAKAKYENVCLKHYGLSIDNYCHFTSPIRRYADLIVHRMMKKYVFDNQDEKEDDVINNQKISNIINENEIKASQIERDISDLRKCQYLQDKIGKVFEGYICTITSFGMFVKILDVIDGLVHISTIKEKLFYDEQEQAYFDIDDNKQFYLGQKVKVKLINIDLIERNVDFEMM